MLRAHKISLATLRQSLSDVAMCFVALLTSCSHSSPKSFFAGEVSVDFDSIRRRGTLLAVTDYNSLNYFVYKGEAVGYQYELLQEYAAARGLELKLFADNDISSCTEMLRTGRADVVAASLVADTSIVPDMAFCEPYARSRMVVVRREKEDYASDTIAVMRGSMYDKFLSQTTDTTVAGCVVRRIPHYGAEQLVGLVADRELSRTLCLENVARASKWYYDSLDISTTVGPEYDLAWAVRHASPELRKDISQWTAKFKKTARYKRLIRKYIIDPREHHSNTQNTASSTYDATYEDIIRSVATDPRYDWIFVSAVVYQESHFNPSAVSWAGACGLMQLMPETAVRFGVDDPYDPLQSVRAGYAFLLWLDKRMEAYVASPAERQKFVLAAYNIGLGHIMDAIRLAQKFGKEPNRWYDNVETTLLLKSNPVYASDPVVKHGFCRGTETVNYVRNVTARAQNYRRLLADKK